MTNVNKTLWGFLVDIPPLRNCSYEAFRPRMDEQQVLDMVNGSKIPVAVSAGGQVLTVLIINLYQIE